MLAAALIVAVVLSALIIVAVMVLTLKPQANGSKYPKDVARWYPDSEWVRVEDLKGEPLEVWKHVDGRVTDYRLTAAGDGPNGPNRNA